MKLKTPVNLPTYPLRPVNGGNLEIARPKIGNWNIEPKFNGWRTLIHVPTWTMFNRHGEALSIVDNFAKALALLRANCPYEFIDAEVLERRHKVCLGTVVILDILLEDTPYSERRKLMAQLPFRTFIHDVIPDISNSVLICPSYSLQREEALRFWEDLKFQNRRISERIGKKVDFYEGVVMKRADSKYPFQLTSAEEEFPHWVKHRWPWK